MDWNKEEKEKMLASAFPFWEKLTMEQQNRMLQGVIGNHYAKGTMLHYGGKECAGVQIIYSGQARVFVTSAGGGEITLFRLLDGDVSILSAACMMRGMDIELDMELETDSEICTIPKCIYQTISEENAEVKDYTLEMISEKFSDIMWLFNQYVSRMSPVGLRDLFWSTGRLRGRICFLLRMMCLRGISVPRGKL